VVESLGEGVDGLEPGQPVVINPGLEHGAVIHVIGEHTQGVHAELAAIPATNVYPLRDGVSFEDAAAFPLVYETAYRMLVTRAALQTGEQVLIWGIGGGVAMAAFRIAQALGAKTIVTSSDDQKLARAAELGADVTVNHESGDVVATVKEAGGADVVVETVGDATWKRSLDAVRPGGRVTVCGATSGPNPPAALHRVWWKQIDILGSTMGTRADFEGAYDLVAAGATPVIDSTFPLAEAAAAHERLEAGEQFGKILLKIGEPV
jgi:NADPH2:quinone reductase